MVFLVLKLSVREIVSELVEVTRNLTGTKTVKEMFCKMVLLICASDDLLKIVIHVIMLLLVI